MAGGEPAVEIFTNLLEVGSATERLLELGWGAAVDLPKCCAEMAVAREPEIQAQRSKI